MTIIPIIIPTIIGTTPTLIITVPASIWVTIGGILPILIITVRVGIWASALAAGRSAWAGAVTTVGLAGDGLPIPGATMTVSGMDTGPDIGMNIATIIAIIPTTTTRTRRVITEEGWAGAR